ncbi:glycoside hydrolase family 43 protein [Alteromonas aestuariivivens]|uniref:Glycoside hydrolase family 43 protein n=1 Tax=Alteromonas aestuariivivens TaxID=1938339 RepID=A0A3D8MER0_9ALTE|nr:glycoside hydrolase family 43 protein [Alteromonas aestuariivivens]RDV29359.1 glycoside hydrolase family 43 protein [Alteromonas aestuariivivens]
MAACLLPVEANETLPSVCFENPVLPGFHPDPSIVRVGDDFYLVNSSFEWFPGVPIFHSKDLVNWRQIGHVLNRPSQLNMVKNRPSSGIWAPTIRYQDGLFYVVVTCKQCQNSEHESNNLFVTAKDPAGSWSEPVWIKGAKGIDPTLFWDDDGKPYYLGTTHDESIGGPRKWPTEDRVYIQPIDLETGYLTGEPTILLNGHAQNARFAEGPHLYRRDGKYIVMIAEGGTWNSHAITVFESDKLLGPYQPQQINPVLTHRHLGNDAQITTLGHADLVDTPDGDWWAVMLGVRPRSNGNYYLGRETFLTSVSWQGTTPIFNPGFGRVFLREQRPDLEPEMWVKNHRDEFDGTELALHWNFLRTPQSDFYRISDGQLLLKAKPVALTEQDNPALVAQRITSHYQQFGTQLDFQPQAEHEAAGLTLYQNDRFHYRLERFVGGVRLIRAYNTDRKQLAETVVASADYREPSVQLWAKLTGDDIQFLFGEDRQSLQPLGELQSVDAISTNHSGGFIGAYAGVFHTGSLSGSWAGFDWFDAAPLATRDTLPLTEYNPLCN